MDATIKALESFPANIHLILGGKDKGSDYTLLNELLRQRVKRVYTIGAAAEKIESQIKGVEIDHSETLETALRRAAATAAAGDIVLLAPACASFDQFRNYEHRGRVFKEVVHALRRSVGRERPARACRNHDKRHVAAGSTLTLRRNQDSYIPPWKFTDILLRVSASPW